MNTNVCAEGIQMGKHASLQTGICSIYIDQQKEMIIRYWIGRHRDCQQRNISSITACTNDSNME